MGELVIDVVGSEPEQRPYDYRNELKELHRLPVVKGDEGDNDAPAGE
jgi:hypothetical protein